jgi:2-amino-4-hydroxy-6-hydroxymethyldihydropteridine diphosphokinase
MQERGFVLAPMSDIVPDWRHPVTGLTVTQMLAALPDSEIGAMLPLD